jgi:hypothetical protein
MKGKVAAIIGFLITLAVVLSLTIWMVNQETIEYSEFGQVAILIVLVASAGYILWDRIKNIRKGLPGKDERTISISYKAGYFGFIAAIWSAVFSPVLIDIMIGYELDGGDVAAIVVLIGGFVFVVSYLYLFWKGK